MHEISGKMEVKFTNFSPIQLCMCNYIGQLSGLSGGLQLKLQLTVVGRLGRACVKVVTCSLAHKLHEVEHLSSKARMKPV